MIRPIHDGAMCEASKTPDLIGVRYE